MHRRLVSATDEPKQKQECPMIAACIDDVRKTSLITVVGMTTNETHPHGEQKVPPGASKRQSRAQRGGEGKNLEQDSLSRTRQCMTLFSSRPGCHEHGIVYSKPLQRWY